MSVFERELRQLLKNDFAVYGPLNNVDYFFTTGEDKYSLEVPMVGILKENLAVDIQDNKLTISAKADTKVTTLAKDYKQAWILPKDASVDNVGAKLENGVLVVTLPRQKPPKKMVNVEVV